MEGTEEVGAGVQPVAIPGTAAEEVFQMSGVEDARTPTSLDNNQVRSVARCVEDSSKLDDIMPVGFGDTRMINDEMAETGEGRRWDDHGPRWDKTEGRKDGFVSTLTRAVSILPEGKPLWGGTCPRIEIEEVDVRPTRGKESEKDPEAWEKKIGKAGIGGVPTSSRMAAS